MCSPIYKTGVFRSGVFLLIVSLLLRNSCDEVCLLGVVCFWHQRLFLQSSAFFLSGPVAALDAVRRLPQAPGPFFLTFLSFFFLGCITCIFSLICALALAYLDRRAEKILHKEQGKTGEVIKLRDIKDFSLPLILVFVICVCYYVAVFPFIGLGK